MVLKLEDFACFVANWGNKADNLRTIASTIGIGIDSLTFVDDNPFERNLVRELAPEVSVPEVGDDPVFYGQCLTDGGYFEATTIMSDDLVRTQQYRANAERSTSLASATDIAGYLDGLSMVLEWSPIDDISLKRATQLANKTNQFNLTTTRHSDADMARNADGPAVLALQFRLSDKFGDSGMIAVVVARPSKLGDALVLDDWLMSCRVLNRRVEDHMLEVIVDCAKAMGFHRLIGRYVTTAKNEMVADLYPRLGFMPMEAAMTQEERWQLDFTQHIAPEASMLVRRT